MSDDESDRLLIDDHDSSVTSGQEDGDVVKVAVGPLDADYPPPVTNGINGLENVIAGKVDESMEEGEILEEMDTGANYFETPPPIAPPAQPLNADPWYSKTTGGIGINTAPAGALVSPTQEVAPALTVDTNSIEKIKTENQTMAKRSPSVKISPGRPKVMEDAVIARPSKDHKENAHSHGHHHHEKKIKEEPYEDRKRLSSFKKEMPVKKVKREMVDASTSVRSVAVQEENAETFFDQGHGAHGVLNYTVIYKTGTNALYLSLRYKEEEYYCVVSDGMPMNVPIKKSRTGNASTSQARDRDDEKEGGRDKGNSTSTPSKGRNSIGNSQSAKRSKATPGEKKRSTRTEEREEEDADSNDESRQTTALFEIPPPLHLHVCGINGCEYKFTRGLELDYHKQHAHATTKKNYDSRCSQTSLSMVKKLLLDRGTDAPFDLVASSSTGVQTDPVSPPVYLIDVYGNTIRYQHTETEPTCDLQRPEKPAATGEVPATTRAQYSDISDDEAPVLCEEVSNPGRPAASSQNFDAQALQKVEATGVLHTIGTSLPSSSSTSNLPMASQAPAPLLNAFHNLDALKGRPSPAVNPPQPNTASPRQGNMTGLAQYGLAASSSPAQPRPADNRPPHHKIHELNAKSLVAGTSDNNMLLTSQLGQQARMGQSPIGIAKSSGTLGLGTSGMAHSPAPRPPPAPMVQMAPMLQLQQQPGQSQAQINLNQQMAYQSLQNQQLMQLLMSQKPEQLHAMAMQQLGVQLQPPQGHPGAGPYPFSK